MGLFSLANLFGITLRESANDGSDFTNPDADYRRVFLGEDGQLHARDSAGAVTGLGGMAQIAQTVLGSDTADITFSSIPGTYSSLMIAMTARTDRANAVDYIDMQFNTDTGANYNFMDWDSVPTGTAATGQTALRATQITGASATANKPGVTRILISDYARTTFHKTVLSEGYNANSNVTSKYSGDWASTSAITQVKLIPAVGPNFKTGTVATLYGLV